MLSTTKNVHNNSSFDNKTIADKLGISVRTVQRHIKKDLNKCISDFITNFLSLFDKCKFEKIEEIITNWGINLNIDIINLILGKIKAILVKSKESFVKIFSLLHNNKSKSLRNKVIPNLFNRFIHKETYHYVRC